MFIDINKKDTFKRGSTPFRKSTEILKNNPNDKVYTPNETAKMIIDTINTKFGISGTILDPCKGPGAFYNNFPDNCQKEYCEIDEGIDFFKYNKKVDWAISNPPYSIFEEFHKKAMEIADNIVWLIPINKLTSSGRRIADLAKWGGIKYMMVLTSKEANFPFGFGLGVIYLQKGYKGPFEIGYSKIFKETYNL